MVYVFTDGHMIFDKKYLTTQDNGKYLAVEQLPDVPKVEGKIGFITGFDVDTKKILFGYSDIPKEPEPIPEPTSQPTETEIMMQALTDAELRDFEAQEERRLLAQQLTDMELTMMGGMNDGTENESNV